MITNFVRKNIATSPELAGFALGRIWITYTGHAYERALQKGVTIDDSLFVGEGMIVEVEAIGSKITKLVVRLSQDAKSDRVFVIVPIARNHWRVITTWLNDKNDTHQTLNKERLTA